MDLITRPKNRLVTTGGMLVGGSICLALAGSSVLAVLPGAPLAMTVLGTVVSAVTGGIVANDIVPEHLKAISVRLQDSEGQLNNEDLTRAVGLAMGLIIQSVAESGNYPEDKRDLQGLAEHTAKAWPKVAKRLKRRSDDTFDVLQDEAISEPFSGAIAEFLNSPILEKESWRNLLQCWLFPEADIWLQGEVLDGVVNCLYERFPLALREVLKADFEDGGRAFAELTLSLLGQMQGSLRALSARPMGEDLGDLQTILEQGVQSLEGLRKRLEKNEAAFRELGQTIDSGFVEVLRELQVTEAKISGTIATLRGWLRGQFQEIISRLDGLQEGQDRILDILEGKVRQEQARSLYILDSNRPTISNWQGRVNELETINGWLDDENRKLGFICGIGGVGKSVLAAKVFAERSDFVRKFWADLGEAPLFSALARKILQEFKIFTAEELGKIEEKNLGTVLINCLQKQRYLLVLDNFESVVEDEDYRQFLQQWLGCFSQTEILVTTQVIPSLKQPKPTEIVLQGFLTEEGVSYLKAMHIGGTDEELFAFISRIKGHPLTLKLVAGFLNEERREGAKIGDLIALGVDLLDEKIDGYHRQETVRLVMVLEASFNRLSVRLRGILGSVLVLRGGFDVAIAAAISREEVTEKELQDLQKRGLLIVVDDPLQPPLKRGENPEVPLIKGDLGGSKSYEFQPLIAEYLKYKKGDLTAAHQRAILFYQGRLKPREEWKTVEDVGEYLEIFHHWCELGEYEAAFDRIRDGSYSDRCADKFLDLRGYNQLRIELYTQLVAGLSNPVDLRYVACLTSLGNTYSFLGEYQQAIALHQQSLEIERQIGNRQGEATSLGNLGTVYYSLGEYQQAIAFHQQQLEIARQIEDRQGEANSLGNLGNAYYSLGEYQQAIAFHQQSLEIQRQIGNRQGEATSLGNLGLAYNSLGEYQQAISLHQQSLEIKRQMGDRRGEANSLYNLSQLYHKVGRVQEGFTAAYQAQEIYQSLDLPLNAYPLPKWMKTIAKFARRSNFNFILCFILGLFAFLFGLVWIVLLFLYRFIRNLFRRR
ncbi:MAG: tetratricopeptide repeat protein [Cyanobacteria bacterium P01_E01_bin.42]